MSIQSNINGSADSLKRRNPNLPDFDEVTSLMAFALVDASGNIILDGEGLRRLDARAVAQLRQLTGVAKAVNLTVTNQGSSGCTVNGVVVGAGQSKSVGSISSELIPFTTAPGGAGKILSNLTYSVDGGTNQVLYPGSSGLILGTSFAIPCVVPGGVDIIIYLAEAE